MTNHPHAWVIRQGSDVLIHHPTCEVEQLVDGQIAVLVECALQDFLTAKRALGRHVTPADPGPYWVVLVADAITVWPSEHEHEVPSTMEGTA